MHSWLRLAVALCSLIAAVAQAGPSVRLDTSLGAVVLEMDDGAAPASVQNFLDYVRNGAYDGTIFHRVIADFVVQGGGFDADYQRRPVVAPVANEADNGLRNRRGTIAMARTNDPHSATNQFFINLADNDFLDHRAKTAAGWGYCVFGRVSDGMEVIDAIAALPTGPGGPFPAEVPTQTVRIERATIVP